MPAGLIKWFPELATALIVAFLAFSLHTGSIARLELSHQQDLASVALKSAQTCEAQKRSSENIANDLQNQIRALRSKSLNPVHVCNHRPVKLLSPKPSGANDGGSGPGKPVRQDGVDPVSLYGIAAEGEEYRLKLLACQAWVREAQRFCSPAK